MAHIKDRVCEGIKQVIGKHDPYDLHALTCLGHGKEKNTCNCDQWSGEKQPRARLSLLCFGAVDHVTEYDIGYRINNLGYDWEYSEEYTAPDMGQVQNVCIIDVQICSEDCIQKQCSCGADQITQPFLTRLYVIRFNP